MAARTPPYLLRRWYIVGTLALDALVIVLGAPLVSLAVVWITLTIAYLIAVAAGMRGMPC